ncbi:hypothetical protein ABBQ32_010064 [Trebouxia sp. C0010 RCD-2024]
MTASLQPSTELLEDLCTRFILNVPAEELESFERLLFLVEQAHWFYEDFSREKDLRLRSYSLKGFVALIFRQVPGLQPFQHQLEEIYWRFNAYKQTIPTMGAIILDPTMEKCLLVRGWRSVDGWGFPTGKINKDEADDACAVREVLEETGFDVGSRLIVDDYIEVHMQEKRSRLYIIQGVEESTPFAPIARKEIGALAWHLVNELPMTKEQSAMVYHTEAGTRHKFFRVYPYIKQLRRWVKNKQKEHSSNGRHAVAAPRGSNAVKSQHHHPHEQQPAVPAVTPDLAYEPQPEQRQEGGCVQEDLETNSRAAVPMPAPVTHCSVPEQPGQAWLNFALDRERVLQHLTFSRLPQTVH